MELAERSPLRVKATYVNNCSVPGKTAAKEEGEGFYAPRFLIFHRAGTSNPFISQIVRHALWQEALRAGLSA